MLCRSPESRSKAHCLSGHRWQRTPIQDPAYGSQKMRILDCSHWSRALCRYGGHRIQRLSRMTTTPPHVPDLLPRSMPWCRMSLFLLSLCLAAHWSYPPRYRTTARQRVLNSQCLLPIVRFRICHRSHRKLRWYPQIGNLVGIREGWVGCQNSGPLVMTKSQ